MSGEFGVDAVKRVKKQEYEEQPAGLLTQSPLQQKITNLFNSYTGFVNNSDVSVWNNRESSSASSQF